MKPDPLAGTVHLPPSHVQVWLEGSALCVRVPNSHTVMFPLDRYTKDGVNIGYALFIDLLRERSTQTGPIATPSAPVQYDIEKAIREFGKPIKKPAANVSEAERDATRATLRKMGML